jgi:oligosaccharide repeat unit polymerase
MYQNIIIGLFYFFLFINAWFILSRESLLTYYSFIWLSGHILLSTQKSFSEYQSLFPFICFSVSYLGLFLGLILGKIKIKDSLQSNPNISIPLNKTILLLALLGGAVGIIVLAQKILQIYSLEEIMINRYLLRSTIQYSNELSIGRVHSWLLDLPLAVILLIAASEAKDRCTYIVLGLAFLLEIAYTLVTMAKLDLTIVMVIFIYMIIRQKLYKFAALLIPVFLSCLMSLQLLRGSVQIIEGAFRSVFETFTVYGFSGIAALGTLNKTNIPESGLGQHSLMRFLNPLVDTPINPYYPSIFLPTETNIYSWLREPYIDLGFIGILLYSFAIGAVYSFSKTNSRLIMIRMITIYIFISVSLSASINITIYGILYVITIEALILYIVSPISGIKFQRYLRPAYTPNKKETY